MPYDPTIPVLGIYHQYKCVHVYTKGSQNVYSITIQFL